jgi:hypothetical protein
VARVVAEFSEDCELCLAHVSYARLAYCHVSRGAGWADRYP